MRLQDKVAIITGSASGMGAEQARLFSKEGANVVLADITDEDGEKIVKEINRGGRLSHFVHTDVTSNSDWENLISETLSRFN